MRRAAFWAIFPALALAGCGGNGSNPFGSLGSLNPFGGGSGQTVPVVAPYERPPGGVLIARLVSVEAEPALRGLIIRATGAAPTEGYYGARLFALNDGLPDENGIVTLQFRVEAPEFPGPAGTENTRQVIAATFVTDAALEDINGFVVVSATNTVSLRR